MTWLPRNGSQQGTIRAFRKCPCVSPAHASRPQPAHIPATSTTSLSGRAQLRSRQRETAIGVRPRYHYPVRQDCHCAELSARKLPSSIPLASPSRSSCIRRCVFQLRFHILLRLRACQRTNACQAAGRESTTAHVMRPARRCAWLRGS